MRERLKDKTRLEHIIHALDIIDLLKKDKTYEECESDVATYYALIKNLEIIDFNIIWDTIETDWNDLREQILRYIEEEK